MYPHERSLVQKFQDKPFVLLGVNSDDDREMVKRVVQEESLTWRSWWNGPDGTWGPIATQWQVDGWPSFYLIDARGVLRFRPEQLRGSTKILDERIEQLVKEATSS